MFFMKRKLPKQSAYKYFFRKKFTEKNFFRKNISKLIFFTNSILQKSFTNIFLKNWRKKILEMFISIFKKLRKKIVKKNRLIHRFQNGKSNGYWIRIPLLIKIVMRNESEFHYSLIK